MTVLGKITKCRVFDGQKIIFLKNSAALTTDDASAHGKPSITVSDIARMNAEFCEPRLVVVDADADSTLADDVQ
jgi:hypothetical protein